MCLLLSMCRDTRPANQQMHWCWTKILNLSNVAIYRSRHGTPNNAASSIHRSVALAVRPRRCFWPQVRRLSNSNSLWHCARVRNYDTESESD